MFRMAQLVMTHFDLSATSSGASDIKTVAGGAVSAPTKSANGIERGWI